jgi:glycine/D-amino acid oxidase-like deaminating enzyme
VLNQNVPKIAIVGAGLSGLAAAYFLLNRGLHVTLFDQTEVGGGASGVCSGLLHPYPGLSARLSAQADEALALTHQLIEIAEKEVGQTLMLREGILRQAVDAEQKERLMRYSDVEQMGEDLFLLKRGCTVFCLDYLQALTQFLQRQGAAFVKQKIENLDRLSAFDATLLAAGFGVKHFVDLPLKYLKGQLLCYKGKAPFPQSWIGKGYVAKTREGFEVGATYERSFADAEPCMETAQKLLPCYKGEFVGVKAAVRVCNLSHYLPITAQLSKRLFVFTGLGSRGLLYHGLFGRKVAEMIVDTL